MKIKLNWGKALVLFFIIFFIWIFSFVFFAMRQNNDLVSEDYYQKGADYTTQINIDRRSLPYRDSVQIIRSDKQLQISLCKSVAASGDSVQVYFFRSSDKGKDVRLKFRSADSPFVIDKGKLFHGRYQVYISWGKGDEKYMVKQILDLE
jgi:hypothetical protein